MLNEYRVELELKSIQLAIILTISGILLRIKENISISNLFIGSSILIILLSGIVFRERRPVKLIVKEDGIYTRSKLLISLSDIISIMNDGNYEKETKLSKLLSKSNGYNLVVESNILNDGEFEEKYIKKYSKEVAIT